MRILLLSQFFPPEIGAAPRRAVENARHWARLGHEVRVLTNVPNSPGGRIHDGYANGFSQLEPMHGFTVRRMFTLPAGKGDAKWKRIAGILFYPCMSLVGGLMEQRPDVIVATAPYLPGLPGALLSLLRGIPLVYDLRDPWVQVGAEAGTIRAGGLPHRMLLGAERAIARRAARVVVIGEHMARWMQQELQLDAPPDVIRNGADLGFLEKAADADVALPDFLQGRFLAGCLGNMNKPIDYEPLLQAAATLKHEGLGVCIVGQGIQRAWLERTVQERGLQDCVAVHPPVPPEQVGAWLRRFDCSVVSMRAEPLYDIFVPVRCLESMGAGTPVLWGGAGEMRDILEEAEAGAAFPAGDTDALVRLLRERMAHPGRNREQGQSAHKFIAANMTRQVLAECYADLLEDVVRQGPRRGA